MRDTKNIIQMLLNSGEGYEMEPKAEEMADTIAWLENLYYKGRIEAFWVNGVKFQEQLD